LAGNRTSILDRDDGVVYSSSDKVLRSNLRRVCYCAIPSIFVSWDNISDRAKNEFKKETASGRYWKYIWDHQEEKKQKIKERKETRIIDWR